MHSAWIALALVCYAVMTYTDLDHGHHPIACHGQRQIYVIDNLDSRRRFGVTPGLPPALSH